MRTVGFVASHKENEKRRIIAPEQLRRFPSAAQIYVEKGYGEVLGISDRDYLEAGCGVCSRAEALRKDIVCDPKIGDAEYLGDLEPGQILFGWVHATQNREATDKMVARKLTVYAWEKMYRKGRYVFWRNRELAGEAAVLHAFQRHGRMPYEAKAAVIGRGNTARGAVRILNMFGAEVVQYDRRTEALLREELGHYDAVVNCVLWDLARKDHIIRRSDLARMRKSAIIIDVSCDRHGAIETSVPTTIEDPVYYVDGICHYAVDHTPAIYFKTFSSASSKIIMPYIGQLVSGEIQDTLRGALIIENGRILDPEIIKHQNR